jgi:hypothetical protein
MQQCWQVTVWYRDSRGLCETGANSSWPLGTSPVKVLADVCEWRGINIDACHDVSVRQIGEPSE